MTQEKMFVLFTSNIDGIILINRVDLGYTLAKQMAKYL